MSSNVRRRFIAGAATRRRQSSSLGQSKNTGRTNIASRSNAAIGDSPRTAGIRIDQSTGASARNRFARSNAANTPTKNYISSSSSDDHANSVASIVHDNNSSHSPRQAHHADQTRHSLHDGHDHHSDHFDHEEHEEHEEHFHHDSHHDFGFFTHFGFGYYPYYHPYYHYDNYNLYSYGYGYSPYYNGYYSSYYDYSPPVAYDNHDVYSNTTYQTNTYYNTSPTSSTTTYTVAPPTPHRAADYYATADNYSNQPYATGWDALADTHDRTAFRYFSRQASRNLDDGLPKLGYALSSAFLGDHQRAAWAMRRAFNTDPYSLTSLRFDRMLHARIDHLAERYAEKADDNADPNADFMLAALSFLIEDNQLASIAINAAIDHGDTSDAAQNLREMIPNAAPGYDK